MADIAVIECRRGVAKLDQEGAALAVDALGEAGQTGLRAGFEKVETTDRLHVAGAVELAGSAQLQAGAAPRPARVVSDEGFARQAVLLDARDVGGDEHAVAQGFGSDPERR